MVGTVGGEAQSRGEAEGATAGGAPRVLGARRAAAALACLSLAGMGVAGYLSWRHAVGGPIACGGSGGCDLVNASRYAFFLGVPVAYLGLGMYTVLFAAALAQALLRRPPIWLPQAVLVLASTGAVFSLYLTAMELFVIRAVCRWCVASQVDILAILALAALLANRATGHGAERRGS